MATLAGRSIKDTYKNVIQVDNLNSGIDSILRQATDGGGNNTPLYIANNKIKIQPNDNNTITFEIQNAAGISLFTVNTTSGAVTIPIINSTTLVATTVNGVYITKGSTGERPVLSSSDVGIHFDTTLNTPVFWNGTNWV